MVYREHLWELKAINITQKEFVLTDDFFSHVKLLLGLKQCRMYMKCMILM